MAGRIRDDDLLSAEVLLGIVLGAQHVLTPSRKKRRNPNNHYDREHARTPVPVSEKVVR